MKLRQTEKTLSIAASKSGMSDNTARKYLQGGQLPSQRAGEHTWRTRKDPFEETWSIVKSFLEENPGFEARTLFEYLQRTFPGKYQDGQLRTLQRKIKIWRALEGPAKEVYFPQEYHPGELAQSDFTHMNKLEIMICGQPFNHMIYHFVLPYSNWETGTICFSESFESLSTGFQNALWELGGVPLIHRTDQFSAALHKVDHPEEFKQSYKALLKHYRIKGARIQVRKPHENGDIEQRHHRFKRAVEQALLLRGSRDFSSREEYVQFLGHLFRQLNAGRIDRFKEELSALRSLPLRRLDDSKRFKVKVGPSSTINVQHNTYSVPSRLIGEQVYARVYADHIDIWYAQQRIERIPRLRGDDKHKINYRHIIHWLIRKPGAFGNYRYRSDLFPSSNFRVAYDALVKASPSRGHKEYLRLLKLAAEETESGVERALRQLLSAGKAVTVEAVEERVLSDTAIPGKTDVSIDIIDLKTYDELLDGKGVAS